MEASTVYTYVATYTEPLELQGQEGMYYAYIRS